jgi:ABC-type transport system involved in cytochrome c biogenesis permease subunit
LNHLVALIVAALGAVGITVVLRAVPPFSRWNERGVKPWACDLCMSFWTTALCLAVGAATHHVSMLEAFFLWMPAFAVAYGTVQRITPPPLGGPPIDPPSADGSEDT